MSHTPKKHSQTRQAQQDWTTAVLPADAIGRFGRSRVNDLAVSPDGDFLALASHIGLWVYTLGGQSFAAPTQLWDAQQHISAVTFSATGTWIATGTQEGVIKVWELASGNCLAEVDRGSRKSAHWVDVLAFSPDSQRLAATGGSPQTYSVDLWHVAPQNDEVRLQVQYDQRIDANPQAIECDCAHAGPIAFSPDNRLLAFPSPGRMASWYAPGKRVLPLTELISVWHVDTGSHLVSLEGLTDKAYSLCFSQCGHYLSAGDESGTMLTWEVPTGTAAVQQWKPVLRSLEDINARRSVFYSPEGQLRTADFSFHDDTLTVREPEHNKTLYHQREDTGTYRPDFSNGKHLAFSRHQDVLVVSMETAETRGVIPFHHVTAPESLQFSADAQTLFARQRHGGIFSLDVAHPDHPPVFKMRRGTSGSDASEAYLSMETTPEGALFAISTDENSVRLWEVGHQTTLLSTFITQQEPKIAAFSPPANRLACKDEEGRIYVYDVQTATLCYTYRSEWTLGHPMELSATGEYLLSKPDGLYDVKRNEKVNAFPIAEMIQYCAFSPDGTRVACESPDTLLLWDIRRCETVLSLAKPGNWEYNVEAVAFSPCGGYLAACATDIGHLQIWSLYSGERIAAFDLPRAAECLAFSPDGTLLASGISDGTILLWDMRPYLKNETC